jgi:hypothetical protein
MDWIEFFNANFIPYVTAGKNTSKGWVSIKCPFCGDDPTEHCGCHPNGAWSCWRDATHKGGKPDRLISALLNVSGPQARLLVQAYTQASPDSFDAPQATLRAPQGAIKPVEYPDEFELMFPSVFSQYLSDRGFDNPFSVATEYMLMGCRVGRWKQRLIIPIYTKYCELIGWQGRAIVDPKKAPRYLTSHAQVKRTIFNLQNLNKGGERLYICEGPFDCLKVDFFGKPKIRATCLFGVIPTPEQIQLLNELSNRFERVIVLFDADTAGITGGFNLSDWIPRVEFASLPENAHDVGEMTSTQIRRYLNDTSH